MDRHRLRSSLRVLAGAFSLLATVMLWQAATPAGAEAAQSDLTFISNSTWQANPTDARVHVLAAVTATSHAVDSDTRRYFYDKMQLTLPSAADGITATAGGRQLPVEVLSATGNGVVVLVGLGQRLYSGQSGSFDLKFDLVDSGGSTDRDLRIGHNLMSFPVWAFGSPHTPGSTVTVIFPPGFTVQEEFGGLTRAVYGSGEVVFSSGVVDDSTQLSAWFTAVQPVPPGDYRVRPITIGSLSVALRYWGDDAAWADQVERVLRMGYPLLRDTIGLGDPLRTSITVEEASTQETDGFSASYDPVGGQVRVSYFADPFTILHEAAHMWFNRELTSERWIAEAFASYYAELAVVRLGLPDHAPYLTDRMRQAAVPLNDWLTRGQPSSATDAYLYGATLEVAREIAAQAGSIDLRSVWAAARSGWAAYQPFHGTEPEVLSGEAADWRRFLDLLEETTGRSFEGMFERWVVNPSQRPLLDERITARAAYHEAQLEAGGWDLPPEIRRALDTWQYPQAVMFIAQARAILVQRDRIVSEAATEQTTPPPTLQAAFERSGIVVASAEAANELAVLQELAAARQAQTDTGGAARALGLLGADPEADLDAAREAFSKGDLVTAMSRATRARTSWQTAVGAGEMRIFGSLCVLAGGLLLLMLLIWSRGDRRRELPSGVTAAGTSESDSGGPRRGEGVPSAERMANRVGPAIGSVAAAAAAGFAAVVAGARAAEARARARLMPAAAAEAGTTADVTAPLKAHRRSRAGAAGARAAAATADGADGRGQPGVGGNGLLPAGDIQVDIDVDESAYELLQRGHALLRDRHNAQAAVVLERAARLERRKGSILEALGRAYFNSGQHARAAETFEALLEIDPSAHYGHFGLGLSYARLGRPTEARTHLRMAAALDPASETYRKALDKLESTIA